MLKQKLRGVSAVDRFWYHVIKRENGCWLFRNNAADYGQMRGDNGKNVTAHRFSYELHNGGIPRGMYVCHKCDVRGCVNPEHLYAGTHEDNVKDIIDRGRHRSEKKIQDEIGRRKLSPDQIEKMVQDYKNGFTQQQLSKKYGLSQGTVSARLRKVANSGVRGSHEPVKRSGHFRFKIDAGKRQEIRDKYATGSYTQKALAEEYGVTQTRVSDIITGRDLKRSKTYLPDSEILKCQ